MFKARTFSEETCAKISDVKGTKVIVCDLLTTNISEYGSIRKAALGLNAPYSTIRYCTAQNKLYIDRYKITLKNK